MEALADKLLLSELKKLEGHSAISGQYAQNSMNYLITVLFAILSISPLLSQDNISFISGGELPVEKIDSLSNDFLYYKSNSKSYKIPIKLVNGYYLTVQSEKNLSKKEHKRKTDFVSVVDRNNLNQLNLLDFSVEYVNSRLPSDLSSLNYSQGNFVNLNEDTIRCEIAILDNISDMASFCILKDTSNGYNIILPHQILSYENNYSTFKAFNFISENGSPYSQFVEQKIKGKINYYIKRPTPLNKYYFTLTSKEKSDKYYLYFPGGRANIYFESDEKKLVYHGGRNGSPVTSFVPKNLNNSFTEIINSLVDDCPMVKYKIQNNFYNASGLESIIEEYNNCEY